MILQDSASGYMTCVWFRTRCKTVVIITLLASKVICFEPPCHCSFNTHNYQIFINYQNSQRVALLHFLGYGVIITLKCELCKESICEAHFKRPHSATLTS